MVLFERLSSLDSFSLGEDNVKCLRTAPRICLKDLTSNSGAISDSNVVFCKPDHEI